MIRVLVRLGNECMSTLRHRYALYFPSPGVEEVIDAEGLVDDTVFHRAANLGHEGLLWDDSMTFRLDVRDGGDTKCRHFYALRQSQHSIRVFERSESNSKEHEERIRELMGRLRSRTEWVVRHAPPYKRPAKVEVARLVGYQWGGEVTRGLSYDILARHDIYGHRATLASSPLLPSLAIEVVHTHYPEDEVVAALVRASEVLPIVVLFDYADRANWFLTIDPTDGFIDADFVLSRGQFWCQGQLTPHKTAVDLKLAMKRRRAERQKYADSKSAG